jgi:hypothetical protein
MRLTQLTLEECLRFGSFGDVLRWTSSTGLVDPVDRMVPQADALQAELKLLERDHEHRQDLRARVRAEGGEDPPRVVTYGERAIP